MERLVAPDLMREYDVGRGTIREVLQRLASTGVVTIMPNKGAQVRRLSRREVAEVLDIVELLLGLAARRAGSAIADPSKRKSFSEHDAALRAAPLSGDLTPFLNAREGYYRYLLELAGSHELQRIFPTVQVHIMRLQLRMFNFAADAADLSDYTELTQAILSGDTGRAELAGRRHVQRTIGRIQQLPDRAFESDE